MVNVSVLLTKAVIIDDELDTCLLLGMALKKFGITSFRAHTLADGLQKVSDEQPTFIFLDNNLPDGIGIEQIAEFQHVAPLSILIVITAISNLRDSALRAGAAGFIEKPLDSGKIAEVMAINR